MIGTRFPNRRVIIAVAGTLLVAAAVTSALVASASPWKDSTGAEPPGAAPEAGLTASDPTSEPASESEASVTMADVEAAGAAVRACLEEAGYTVEIKLPSQGLRRTQFTFYGDTADHEGVLRANEAFAECRETHSSAVTDAWNRQQGKPTQEQLEELHDRLYACVADGGVPRLLDAVRGTGEFEGKSATLAFSPYTNLAGSPMEIQSEDLDVYSSCALEMEAQLGLTAPLPWPTYWEEVTGIPVPGTE